MQVSFKGVHKWRPDGGIWENRRRDANLSFRVFVGFYK